MKRGGGSANLPLALFSLALISLIFTIGMFVGANKYMPYRALKSALNSTELILEEMGMITGVKPVRHLRLSRYPGDGVVQRVPEKMSPGLTLISSFFDDGLEIRLIDPSGNVVNRWPVSYNEIWSDHEFVDPALRPKTDWNVLFNGILALPDGSIVFPLGGLVKMDQCGQVVWRLQKKVHHSLELNSDGNFWVPGERHIREKSKHAPVSTPYIEHTMLQISDAGEVVQEISILDVLWNNKLLPLIFANNRVYDTNIETDIIHLNDVEEIPEEYLDSFPQFSRGDILVSLRETNMVLVLDPSTQEIKWYKIGPWIQAHDPDWQPDGTITVFDNNYDNTKDGSSLGGSNIISIDPQTDETRYLYGKGSKQHFYTAVQGDHQVLENGNILIVESNAGRVFEVTPEGQVVWDFINRYSDEEVYRVPDAVRYPLDYFTVDDWSCE